MSGVGARSSSAATRTDVLEFVADHKWKVFAVVSTTFWIVWGYVLDLFFDWDLAGGVTAAFAFVWLFNVVFVAVFLQVIKLATRWAER